MMCLFSNINAFEQYFTCSLNISYIYQYILIICPSSSSQVPNLYPTTFLTSCLPFRLQLLLASKPLSPVSAAFICMVVGPFTGARATYPWPLSPEKRDSPFSAIISFQQLLRQGCGQEPLPTHFGILTGLILCVSPAGNCGCYAPMHSAVRSFPEGCTRQFCSSCISFTFLHFLLDAESAGVQYREFILSSVLTAVIPVTLTRCEALH